MLSQPFASRYTPVLAAIVVAAACAGDNPTSVGRGSFAVVSTAPAPTATNVSLTPVISVTFSDALDPSSVSAATFTISNGVSGTVAVNGASASFAAAAPLTGGTSYTATVAGSVRSQAGVALGSSHSWTFRTVTAAPAPAATFPLTTGKRWRYARNDTTTVSALSTGTSTSRFTGEQILWVAEQLSYQGRTAARLVVLGYNSTASGSTPQFTVAEEYLSQTSAGLDRWRATGTGGQWRPVLSNTAATLVNGTFLLTQGPSHGDDIQLSAAAVAVPAGSFTTVRARHASSNWAAYAPEHWDEVRVEDFADNVGLVRSQWSYLFDDKDPAAADFSQRGSIVLTHVDAGPIPTLAAESEANDTSITADPLTLPRSVVEGVVAITHAGATLTNALVGCATACVHPNENGQIRMQDWYRLDVTSSVPVRVELQFAPYDAGTNQWNDLDLYAFQPTTSGGIRFVAGSTGPEGEPEAFTGTLSPGTYYFAVQAWKTRGAAVRYWLSVR